MQGSKDKIKVLVASPLLEAHWIGGEVVSKGLRDAGMEVVYLGCFNTPEMIIKAAVDEDVDVIGLSMLSGEHIEACTEITKLLKEKGLDDIPIVAGGIIPDEDKTVLDGMGVSGNFGPGTPIEEIRNHITQKVELRREKDQDKVKI